MVNRNPQELDQHIRGGLDLLADIAKSPSFSREEVETIENLHNSFLIRMKDMQLHLGIIGEFSSGKSTLLNAILKRPLAATSDRPCTPVPIFIRGGTDESITVKYQSGRTEVADISRFADLTTYGQAPKDVAELNVVIRSPFLAENRVVLVDTPGINAMEKEHTLITQSTLHRMHAAILLMYSKQPGSKSTIDFLGQAADQVHKLFVCVSKSDFLNSEQLDRVVSELPARILKGSGIDIGRVYPVHISQNEQSDDFDAFMSEIHVFMEHEWYESIARDLHGVLLEYIAKVRYVVNNRLLLQEKIFYEYMAANPTDFTSVASQIRKTITDDLDACFSESSFRQHALCNIKADQARILAGLENDIRPGKNKVLGFEIEKKAVKKEVDSAIENLNNSMGALAGRIDKWCDSAVNDYKDRLISTSKAALSSINDVLSAFDERLLDVLRTDPETIGKAKVARRNRYLFVPIVVIPALVIMHFVLASRSETGILWYVIGASSAALALYLPFSISKNPKEADVDYIARQRLSSMESFSMPYFGYTRSGSVALNALESSNFHLEHQRGINVAIGQGANIARIATGSLVFLPIGLAAGLYSWMRTPTARVICEDLQSKARESMSSMERGAIERFQSMRDTMQSTSNDYVNQLPVLYASILDTAFTANRQLLEQMEDSVKELERFNDRLDAISRHLLHD